MEYPFEALAEEFFGECKGMGAERMAFCPEHPNTNTPALSVNVQDGVFNCHGCGFKGSFHSGNGRYRVDNLSLLLSQIDSLLTNFYTTEEPVIKLDDSILQRYRTPTDYWINRGIKQGTQEVYELGHDTLNNAAVIPNRDRRSNLVGISKRFLDPDVQPRHKHSTGFKKADHLFGLHLFDPKLSDTLVVVEGQTDAMKAWQAGMYGVAIYGASISLRQIQLLRQSGAERFILALDNYHHDIAGRKANSRCKGLIDGEYDARYDLRRGTLGVYDAPWRKGHPKDLGDMDDRFIYKFLNSSYSRDLRLEYSE